MKEGVVYIEDDGDLTIYIDHCGSELMSMSYPTLDEFYMDWLKNDRLERYRETINPK